MYQPKSLGILELLMNALSLPRHAKPTVRHARHELPRRRESIIRRSVRGDAATREMYFQTAQLSRWTR